MANVVSCSHTAFLLDLNRISHLSFLTAESAIAMTTLEKGLMVDYVRGRFLTELWEIGETMDEWEIQLRSYGLVRADADSMLLDWLVYGYFMNMKDRLVESRDLHLRRFRWAEQFYKVMALNLSCVAVGMLDT